MPLSAGAGDQAAQLLDDRGCRRRRLAGRVHKPVELVVLWLGSELDASVRVTPFWLVAVR